MLISFVGGDASGKGTQIERCSEWIRNEMKLPVRVVTRFDLLGKNAYPEFAFADCTREELAEEYLPQMKGSARAVFLMYTFAVALGRNPPLRDEVVLVDGYWQKNLGTEGAMGIDQEWFTKLCSVLPKPDVTLLFDIDPHTVLSRGRKGKPYECGCDFTRSDTSFIRHQSKVREILLSAAKSYGWHKIDASRSEDAIAVDVRRILEPEIARMSLVRNIA